VKPEFVLKFATTSADFVDEWGHAPAEILRGIASELDGGMTAGDILDSRKKKIGSWTFSNPQLIEKYG
jgi:hypothetical protein